VKRSPINAAGELTTDVSKGHGIISGGAAVNGIWLAAQALMLGGFPPLLTHEIFVDGGAPYPHSTKCYEGVPRCDV